MIPYVLIYMFSGVGCGYVVDVYLLQQVLRSMPLVSDSTTIDKLLIGSVYCLVISRANS